MIKIKDYLPITKREYQKIIDAIDKTFERTEKLVEQVDTIHKHCVLNLSNTEKKIAEDLLRLDSKIQTIQNQQVLQQQDLTSFIASYLKMTDQTYKDREKTNRTINEILWAEIFISTIQNSRWFNSKSLSPGRWAVGYPYLFVLYRVLDQFTPANILETGLGQSSKMINQYALTCHAKHTIIEHDQKWIDFFVNEFGDNQKTIAINHLNLIDVEFNQSKLTCYDHFSDVVADNQYDLVTIDGPVGSKHQTLARIDVLQLIPQNLKKSFVIIIDDYDRQGEQKSVELIEEKLGKNNISFKKGIYSGAKDVIVIASEDNSFYCTL